MVHTDLWVQNSRTFQGLFKELLSLFKEYFRIEKIIFYICFGVGGVTLCTSAWSGTLILLVAGAGPKKHVIDELVFGLVWFCLCFSLFKCEFNALLPMVEMSTILSQYEHTTFLLSVLRGFTQSRYAGSHSQLALYRHWPLALLMVIKDYWSEHTTMIMKRNVSSRMACFFIQRIT